MLKAQSLPCSENDLTIQTQYENVCQYLPFPQMHFWIEIDNIIFAVHGQHWPQCYFCTSDSLPCEDFSTLKAVPPIWTPAEYLVWIVSMYSREFKFKYPGNHVVQNVDPEQTPHIHRKKKKKGFRIAPWSGILTVCWSPTLDIKLCSSDPSS